MASNKHYAVDLLDLTVQEVEPPKREEILEISERSAQPNPFETYMKRYKYVVREGEKWLLPKKLESLRLDEQGYQFELCLFEIALRFDAPIHHEEIASEKFLYSLSMKFERSGWRNNRPGGGAFFQLGSVEQGSVRANLWAGIVVFGTAVANYPELKQGFREVISDAQFVATKIESAIRASKIPNAERIEEEPLQNDREQHEGDNYFFDRRRRQRDAPRLTDQT